MQKDAASSIALRLHPKWWRDRYLDEAQVVTNDLVATGRSRWRIATNLAFGAMRARLNAAGMPLEYDRRAARTVWRSVWRPPAGPGGRTPDAHHQTGAGHPLCPYAGTNDLASLIYLALILAFFGLGSTMIWGYFSLSGGVFERKGNGRLLRSLARAPLYLILAAVVLFIVSVVIGPHHYVLHGETGGPIDGHPFGAQVLRALAATMIALCGLTSAVLIALVVRHGDMSVSRLISGKGFAITIAGWLWTMTAAAFALATVYSAQVSMIGHIAVTSTALGHSLFLFVGVLLVLAFVSTAGSALARSLVGHNSPCACHRYENAEPYSKPDARGSSN